MLNKTKKVAFLTSGLAGALVVSSAAGVALSSCTTTTSSSDSSDKYTYAIDWTDQDQVKQLTIDEQGIVYSSASKTEIIAVAPNTAATSFVIPASVRHITGYNLITKNSDGTVATSTSYGAFQGLVSLISVTFASSNTLVSVGDSAFSGCTYLSTIDLPSSTSVVYNNAFENCANLRSIDLSGVSYIGSSAFSGAMSNGAAVSLDLSSASYIGASAFANCTSLVGADFSKNTTLSYIGISAFAGAFVSGDTTATLDFSSTTALKTISDSAFKGCTNLGSVVLPSSSVLTTIGENAFNGATNLTQVGSVANTFTAPSTLGNYATTTISSSDSTYYVSSGIGANAFSGTKIATINLSAITVATPFTNATFKGMTSLSKVEFGSSSKITTIPYSLFEGDTALTSLTLPSSITSIANGSNNSTTGDTKSPFYGSGLVTVDMSAITSYNTSSATWWGANLDYTTMVPIGLFQDLTSLTTVVLKTGTVVIGSDAFNGASALKTVKENSTSTKADTTGLIIPSTLEMINVGAFKGSGIESIAFADTSASNSLWFLAKTAFQNTTDLTSVDLAAADTTGTHSIKQGAITGESTTDLTLTGLSAISSNLFDGSTSLKTVKLPTSVTHIYGSAFVDNTVLSSVNFDELTKLDTITTGNFTGANALTSIDLSNTAMTATSYKIANIFTGLPSSATVKLSSLATTLADTSFLTGENTTASVSARPTIEYPNGLTLTTGTSTNSLKTIGANSSTGTNENPMLTYASGELDLTSTTSGVGIQEYYPQTFFGNTKLEKLTLSAASLNSSTSQQTTLFIHNRGTHTLTDSTYYKANFLPFGDNEALTELVFSGFTLEDEASISWPQVDSADDTSNSLYRTSSTTWAQVATIINKFASNSTTTALTSWPTVTNNTGPDSTYNISYDSTISGTGDASAGSSGNYTVTFSNSQDTATSDTYSSTATISNTITETASKTFIHNGVSWTLSVVKGGAITLVGTDINIYKVTRPSSAGSSLNPYQAYFYKDSDGVLSKIKVTLNIYTPSSN